MVSCCEYDNEPWSFVNVRKCSTSLGTISFSIRTLQHGVNLLSYGTVLARSLAFVSLCKIQQHLSKEWTACARELTEGVRYFC